MNNKERYLKFIKDFNDIGITKALNETNMGASTFYLSRYSLDNMQNVTNIIRRDIKELYSDIMNDDFILDTKEKNIEFVKDLKEIGIIKICNSLKIARNDLYVLKASDTKYEMVINEIKRQLDLLYKKYSEK
ncbi:MAG: hypothetical protein IJV31_08035 [Clostridia bacterium]|nr:hypothetical protein [Clostridia bacterium]